MLSKIIIFVTRHNTYNYTYSHEPVVNCFQKLLSSWHDTTYLRTFGMLNELWIAFKNYYLRDTTQRNSKQLLCNVCCELLSKIIIFVTRHNTINTLKGLDEVVNCFQKLLSSWHDTTEASVSICWGVLWIAFKNYYLRDTTQLFFHRNPAKWGCELLSKIIIFVTRHNPIVGAVLPAIVVNCFQKLLSSWHDTTCINWPRTPNMLWIAFKNYYLRDTTQPGNI